MTDGHALPNVLAVVDYLTTAGFKAGNSTVYLHVKAKKLKPDPDGTFNVKSVLRYARKHLKRKDGSAAAPEADQLQDAKAKAETRKLEAQADHWEIKAKAISGRYIERTALEHELALRASFFRNDIEAFFRSRAGEIIHCVSGDPERAPDLIDYLLTNLETWMDRYASDSEYHIPIIPVVQDDDDSPMEEDEA